MSEAFVHTLALKTSPQERAILAKRLEAGRQLFNACLGEALERLRQARESKAWQSARRESKKTERSKLFREVQKRFKLSDYEVQAFAIQTKNACSLKDHLDANTTQKIGTRVWNSVSQYMFGKRGKPRFKSKGQFRSLEGKSNSVGIRFKDSDVVWGSLRLKPLFDRKDKHGVEAHALNCKTKYVRIVCKNIKGKSQWFAQLVQEGQPHCKFETGTEVVGLDIGPSSIAVVSSKDASLEAFCPGLKKYEKETRLKQRALDRSRRKTNPDNFNENGTVKGGPKKWVRSKRYRQIRNELAETQRRLAETRKCQQGALANRILRMGSNIQTEKLSYKSFQRLWGKAIGQRAPGMFVEILRRKALSAGGAVNEFPTTSTKLSQACHGCGSFKKKKLSERWHECGCGVGPVQRDLYSAFLARCIKGTSLDMNQAEELWSGAKPLLEQAISRLNQSANGGLRLSSFGLSKAQRQSASLAKNGSMSGDVRDVVQMAFGFLESSEEPSSTAIRTPCL